MSASSYRTTLFTLCWYGSFTWPNVTRRAQLIGIAEIEPETVLYFQAHTGFHVKETFEHNGQMIPWQYPCPAELFVAVYVIEKN